MGDEIILEDWLWDDDAPEEDGEQPLTPSELALRKRMIQVFVGSAIAVIVVAILSIVTFKVFTPSDSNKIPTSCLRGKISDCPSTKDPTSFKLPGGGKSQDPENDASKGKAKKLLERCLNGDIEACNASKSGG